MKSYRILGVDISPYTINEFFTHIEDRLSQPNRHQGALFIVTVNPEIATYTIYDDEFKHILQQSQINTADGVGISWAVNYIYREKVDRITGSDSMKSICRLCEKHARSVFLYGAQAGVASKAAAILKEELPLLTVQGTYSPDRPDMNFEEHPKAVQNSLSEAEVVFVALGAPAQEKWMYRNLAHLTSCRLIIGIGGSFDFIAGTVKRAPVIFRKSGMEWLYRLYQQPSRWRRMLKLPLFAFNIVLLRAELRSAATLNEKIIRE